MIRTGGGARVVHAMRARKRATLVSFVAAGASVLGGYVMAPIGNAAVPGLVAAYAFDEGSGTSVADASGSGNTGTAANTTWAGTGKYGGALSFNGTSSRVTVPDSASLQLTGAMTLEAWVNPSTVTSAWRDVIAKGNDNYYLMATSTPQGRPAGGAIIRNRSTNATGTANLATSTWTHLAATFNGSALRLYVNGTLVRTTSRTGNIATSTDALTIGSDPFYGQYFTGLIDEIRIYNVELSQAQIQADMATPVAPAAPDTQPPSAPGTLSATAFSSSRVDLSWGTASDNVAVAGYRIERCQGVGCSSFSEIAAPAGTGTSYSDATAAASTSYSYRVRAVDAVPNFGPYSNTATAVTPAASAGPTPVAAYAFDEASGTGVVDASGSGNNGTAANTTRTAAGRYGGALSFNGTSSRVTIPDSASLHLTTAMTLEAWVSPTAVSGSWADVIEKGNDNYFLMAGSSAGGGVPAGGGTIGLTYGTAAITANTWTHLAVTYDKTTIRLYVNGAQVSTLANTANLATSTDALTIGSDPFYGQYFQGLIDELRIYNVALTPAQIQADMVNPIVPPVQDPTPPTVAITSPAANSQLSDIVNVTADASDNIGVLGVQFFVDGVATGFEDPDSPYGLAWDTRAVSNGAHTLTARARDGAGNSTLSAPVAVNVTNANSFQNEVLASGFNLPTSMTFLPDGRMLVTELPGKVQVLSPPYTSARPTPFVQLTNVGNDGYAGVQQGIFSIALDPDFAVNRYVYLFYTMRTPNRDRLSRFTVDETLSAIDLASEFVLYQDPSNADTEHHGGAIVFGNDGKLYFTTGDHFQGTPAQDLTSPRGKIHRINLDGTIPAGNPFDDGAGSNVDSIWALGLRNPFRAYYDAPTGRLFVGDVGGNDYATAREEVDLGARGANYGWPDCENGTCGNAAFTAALYSYPHNGRDASITGGFVYHGSVFPSSYQGSYFFADYAQNWIRRMTFDANGNVNGVFNFEPADGSVDGPYGDIVYLTEGPDGALYYIDLGYSDVGGTFGVSKIRRIRFTQSNQAPVAIASATPTSGPAPLDVAFSSGGSFDPEGQPLTYSWTLGDNTGSSEQNPAHRYSQAGQYSVTLSVSDGVNTTLSTTIVVRVGSPPTATILTPQDGITFRAGDVISFSGDATDQEDGTLPATAFAWTVDFLHAGHVHPGTTETGVKSGTFTIATTGHDFSGDTRFRITLTVTDSDGLTSTTSVIVWPEKVNLTFNTAPAGLALYLDGIAKVTPFVYDTLVGYTHTIEARNQSSGSTNYTFESWSDGGGQQHTIAVPAADNSYTATYSTTSTPATPAFVQVAASTPQTSQTTVTTAFSQAQTAGNLNVVVVGWNNATSNITSVTDSRGNAYQLAAATTRSGVISQAIYYAKNIAAGANTVTVTLNTATPYVDVRIAEYAGLDPINPLDVTASAGGANASPSSGTATTTTATELLVGAGTTTGGFTGAGSGYTTRIITSPDSDILEDRVVTSTGSYSATAIQSSATWVMQLVTFRAAGQ